MLQDNAGSQGNAKLQKAAEPWAARGSGCGIGRRFHGEDIGVTGNPSQLDVEQGPRVHVKTVP